MITAFTVFLVVFICLAQSQTIPDEDWGYVSIRANANLFWWLYGSQNKAKRAQQPLVIWLQGGPGGSSCGFGNFQEIGPLDVNLKPRQYTWIQNANVLFIDSPVGTGYSYVTAPSAYVTTDDQIGGDIVSMLKAFLTKHPMFQTLPLYIFCESYGGKEATSLSVALVNALNQKTITANFKGVALGDSWISPIDFITAYADYLFATSEVDSVGQQKITASAQTVVQAVNNKNWATATQLWGSNQGVIEQASDHVDFYNILNRAPSSQFSSDSKAENDLDRSYRRMMAKLQADPLTTLMNGPIRQKLGIIPTNVTWGGQSNEVFSSLSVAFMQPYIDRVDFLLSQGVNVTVYSGNLDLICCTTGTMAWMAKLKWSDYSNFLSSTRNPVSANGQVVAFYKHFKNLSLWNILGAGHMVPEDQPVAGLTMLDRIIGQ